MLAGGGARPPGSVTAGVMVKFRTNAGILSLKSQNLILEVNLEYVVVLYSIEAPLITTWPALDYFIDFALVYDSG